MNRLAPHCYHYTAARTAALISTLVVMSAPVLADEYTVARYTTVRIVPTTAQRAPLADVNAQRGSADDKQASHPRDVAVPGTNPLKPATAPPKACDE